MRFLNFFIDDRKLAKNKLVVWEAIRTVGKPEEMVWTAEIGIYRLVMSKGSQWTGKISKWSRCFWISGPFCKRIIVDACFFLSFSFRGGSRKSIFIKILIKNIFLSFLTIFIKNEKMRFVQNSRKQIKFHQNVQKTCLGILCLIIFE